MQISIIILTYNSESSIAETLQSANLLSDDIHVVDSFSTDRTTEIARKYGANVVTHVFEHYGAQRNWAIASLPLKYNWQLHLDADERITAELLQEILSLNEQVDVNGFYIPRVLYFLGKPIRHGGMCPTWHMRLFKSGFGKCEARKYDQHFYITAGQTNSLKAFMIDDVKMSLSEWTSRHNRWSDAEMEEQINGGGEGRIIGRLSGNRVEKKRFWRQLYNAFPLFLRPFILFFYRYVLRLGFLDGATGFIFYVLQSFWFRFIVDAKIFERKQKQDLIAKQTSDPGPGGFENLHANAQNN